MSITGWYGIVYTSADDAKSSLPHVDDVKLLQRALARLRHMKGQATKIKYVERRIHELAGCQHRGCKKKATTVHCNSCKLRSCREHSALFNQQNSNHGGFPDSGRTT